MPKKTKVEIQIQKEIRKQANRARDRLCDEPAMYCTAISGKKVISTLTGVAHSQINYYQMREEFKEALPWKDKKEKITRPFEACAEAKAWLFIKSHGYNPKTFRVKAHNRFFKSAPPCKNCKEWVNEAFAAIEGASSEFRTFSRQYPK